MRLRTYTGECGKKATRGKGAGLYAMGKESGVVYKRRANCAGSNLPVRGQQ